MIARLRVRHRVTFTVLALALPVAFAAAIVGRSDVHGVAALPSALFEHDASAVVATESQSDARDGRAFALERTADGRTAVVSQVAGEPAPDVLAYACASLGADDGLPADALLLGALEGAASRFELPRNCVRVLLFSLAHGDVVAAFDLAAL